MNDDRSLIIVDDEPLARQALRRILETHFEEYTILGEAHSGPSGLELFRRTRPSIVVMDIRIPGFDGLEASRQILRESPQTQILVLSAFDDFRYAQEALHDGVLGYLLKPVREQRLRELLKRAVRRIEQAREWERTIQDVQTYRSIAVRNQVAAFLYGRKGGISAREFAELTDPAITQGYFIVFRVENGRGLTVEQQRIVLDRVDRMGACLPGDWMGPCLPVFVPFRGGGDAAWRSDGEFLAREIRHLIGSLLNRSSTAGIGPVRQDPEQFGDSFRLAYDALQEDGGVSGTLFAGLDLQPDDRRDRYPNEREREFLEACRASDGAKALRTAEALADALVSQDRSLMDARFAVTEFLIVFRREWEQFSGEPRRRSMANLLREALLCPDHVVLKDWFLLVVRDLVRNLASGEEGEDFLLRKVRHFVDLNDLREVSLETSAASVGVSPAYLSRLYKERTGKGFHEYVLDRRLETAARLLTETHRSVSDIASSVGYADAGYFGRIFRRRYGSSPRDYRNRQ